MLDSMAEADAWWRTHSSSVQTLLAERLRDPLFDVFTPAASVAPSKQPLGIERGWTFGGPGSSRTRGKLEIAPLREFRQPACIPMSVMRRPDAESPASAVSTLGPCVQRLLRDVRTYLLVQLGIPPRQVLVTSGGVELLRLMAEARPADMPFAFVATSSDSFAAEARSCVKEAGALEGAEVIPVRDELVRGADHSALLVVRGSDAPRLVAIDVEPAVMVAWEEGVRGYIRLRLVADLRDEAIHAYRW